MTTHKATPVVYGSPGRLAALLAATTRLIDHEPDEVFTDAEVRQTSQQLADLIERRVALATSVTSVTSATTASRTDDRCAERSSC